jgi:uncharacterized protein DUF5681
MSNKNQGGAHYDVGFCKTPVKTRFKKGQSGNPNGRPKGSRNLRTDAKWILNSPVTVTENGKTRKISTQRAIMLGLKEKGLKGDTKSRAQLLALGAEFNNDEESVTKAGAIVAEEEAALADFIGRLGITTEGPTSDVPEANQSRNKKRALLKKQIAQETPDPSQQKTKGDADD